MSDRGKDDCRRASAAGSVDLDIFASEVVQRLRACGNVWDLPGGRLLLPRVFGFCRGVKRALAMLQQAVAEHHRHGGTLFLLGQIIHNPFVNKYFSRCGVRILSGSRLDGVEQTIGRGDCAVIPAFGVPVEIERHLAGIGCRVVDTSCGDVRRLWGWAQRAVEQGFGVLIFGRADHDETVVTKSRLAAAGGRYVVVGDIDRARVLCDLISGERNGRDFRKIFDDRATNADRLEPFERLAQVSQTTMLYSETIQIRDLVRRALARRFGRNELDRRVMFEPTVCRATQERQSAAVELCRGGLDLAVVVGGFGSSNTRHLYELAAAGAPAWFIEDAEAIISQRELATIDLASDKRILARGWLPARRPLRIGVLGGASSPEIVVGQVLQRLAEFLRQGEAKSTCGTDAAG